MSAEGILQCLDLQNGRRIWHCDTTARFNVQPNMYGVGSTPVVFEDLILVVVGGYDGESAAGVAAFDKRTGSLRYTLSETSASYASIQTGAINGKPKAFAFMREGLIAFDPVNGKQLAFQPWAAKVSGCVNAATPVLHEDQVFVSEAYGPGSTLVRLVPDGFQTVWRDPLRSRERVFRAHWATPILHEGHLYGCSGRHSSEGTFVCVNWKTGQRVWQYLQRSLSSVCFVDGYLINLSEDGTINLIEATPQEYREVARFKPTITGVHAKPGDELLLNYPVWASPIVARDLLVVRGKHRIAPFDLN